MLASTLSRESRALAQALLRGTVPRIQCRASSTGYVPQPGGVIGDDHIVRSKRPEIPDFKHVTLLEGVRGRFPAGNWGEKTAYECSVTGYKLTHNEVYAKAASFGAALQQMGLKHGDIVAILLPNCPQYAPILHGICMSGIVASPMSPALTPPEIAKMVAQVTPKAVVTFPQFLPVIRGLQKSPAGASIKDVIVVGESQEGCHNFEDMAKADASSGTFLQGDKIDTREVPAMILWSSGTTGPPKGAVLTHFGLSSQLEMIISEGTTMYWTGVEVGLGLIPFFHVFGAVVLCSTTLQIGAKVVTLPKFDPQHFTKVIKENKFSVMHVVPPLIGFLATNPALSKEDFVNLHSLVCGGAPPNLQYLHGALAKAEKYFFCQEVYGMTEASGGTHILPPATYNKKLGSPGPPTPSTISKIIDVDSGATLPTTEKGEILVKGPQLMKGYYNNEEATRGIINSEGWLHTGDIGYYDEDGCLHVVDRLKDLIKVKGMQVSPCELEAVIAQNAKVADVAVIGVPDERAGELPRAYIVRRDPSLTEDELNSYVDGVVAAHKQLKGGVEFVDAIPKTSSGKVLRKDILAAYKEKTHQ